MSALFFFSLITLYQRQIPKTKVNPKPYSARIVYGREW